MANKLSMDLMDAYMVGDKKLIADLKAKADVKLEHARIDTKVTPMLVSNSLSNQDAKSMDIYNLMNKSFGSDWWEWEIETIDKMLWVRFGMVLEDANRDKVLAIRHLSNSNLAFSDWYEFNQIAVAFGGGALAFDVIVSPTPGVIMSSVELMKAVRPGEEVNSEVKKYISILLIAEGIYVDPPTLSWLIKDEMASMVSNQSKEMRNRVYVRYRDMLTNRSYRPVEEAEDIQARRLMRIEKASITY